MSTQTHTTTATLIGLTPAELRGALTMALRRATRAEATAIADDPAIANEDPEDLTLWTLDGAAEARLITRACGLTWEFATWQRALNAAIDSGELGGMDIDTLEIVRHDLTGLRSEREAIWAQAGDCTAVLLDAQVLADVVRDGKGLPDTWKTPWKVALFWGDLDDATLLGVVEWTGGPVAVPADALPPVGIGHLPIDGGRVADALRAEVLRALHPLQAADWLAWLYDGQPPPAPTTEEQEESLGRDLVYVAKVNGAWREVTALPERGYAAWTNGSGYVTVEEISPGRAPEALFEGGGVQIGSGCRSFAADPSFFNDPFGRTGEVLIAADGAAFRELEAACRRVWRRRQLAALVTGRQCGLSRQVREVLVTSLASHLSDEAAEVAERDWPERYGQHAPTIERLSRVAAISPPEAVRREVIEELRSSRKARAAGRYLRLHAPRLLGWPGFRGRFVLHGFGEDWREAPAVSLAA